MDRLRRGGFVCATIELFAPLLRKVRSTVVSLCVWAFAAMLVEMARPLWYVTWQFWVGLGLCFGGGCWLLYRWEERIRMAYLEYNAPGKLDRGISYNAVSEHRRKARSWRHSATTTVPSSKPR